MEQRGVVAFHELEAAVEVALDPTVDVPQTVGHRPARLAEPLVNRCGVAFLEPLDDHEQHSRPPRLRTWELIARDDIPALVRQSGRIPSSADVSSSHAG